MENSKIMPKTGKELADEYGIDVKIFNAWLIWEGLDIPPGLICPKHLTLIREKLGSAFKAENSGNGIY